MKASEFFVRKHVPKMRECFVLMPFHEALTAVYEHGIKPQVESMGMQCKRADEIYSGRAILGDIWTSIQTAELVIVDCTSKNPNVMYELGLCHALWKRVILLSQKKDDVPFDLRVWPVIWYDLTFAGAVRLKEELGRTIEALRQEECVEAVPHPMQLTERVSEGSSFTPILKKDRHVLLSYTDKYITGHANTTGKKIHIVKNKQYDVFLSHSSMDKEGYAKPLAEALSSAGITYWLDDQKISWGDSISKKINEGLRQSRFVILFLSEKYIDRGWTNAEMQAAVNRQNSDGKKVVLPLFIGDRSKLIEDHDLLRDIKGISWDIGIDSIVENLKRLLP